MNIFERAGKTAAAGFVSLTLASAGHAGASDDWEFGLSPLFLWGKSVDGDSSINGKTAPVDLDFRDDILENMEAVFTVHFEARRGDWAFFTEYQYVDLEPNIQAKTGPISINANVTFKEKYAELGGAWTFSRENRTRWELLAGGRYTDQNIKVVIKPSGPGDMADLPEGKIRGGDDWVTPFVGVRVFHSLGERWTFIGRADYGYGGSDNTVGNVALQFDYRFNDWGSVFIGGRYMKYDYDDDSYSFKADETGPLAGLTVHW